MAGIVTFAARLRLEHNGLESVVVPDSGSAERDPGDVLAGADSEGAKYLFLVDMIVIDYTYIKGPSVLGEG